jgi:hypothetical protein
VTKTGFERPATTGASAIDGVATARSSFVEAPPGGVRKGRLTDENAGMVLEAVRSSPTTMAAIDARLAASMCTPVPPPRTPAARAARASTGWWRAAGPVSMGPWSWLGS